MSARWSQSLFLLLLLAGGLLAQTHRSSGLAQLHGPFWAVEGPTRLEAVADLNGDGRLDLVIRSLPSSSFPDRLKAVLSQPDGGWRQEGGFFLLPAQSRRLVAGDVDGDGLADLVIETDAANATWGAALLLVTLDGSGVATGQTSLLTNLAGPLDLLGIDDREGDGDDDLITLGDNGGTPRLAWIESLGSGQFLFPAATSLSGTGPHLDLATEDLDQDGQLDVILLGPTDLERYLSQGSAFTALAPIPHGLGTAFEFAAADLEGDGDLDFVVDGAANEGFVVLRADGGGYSSSAPAPIAGSGPGSHLRRLLGVGDLDQDGRVELAFLERPSSSWATDYGKVVFLAGAADLAPVAALEMPFGPSSGYSLVTWMPRRVLDLDGDGLLDLLGDGGMILGDGRGRPPVQTLSRRGSLHDLDHDGDLDLVNPDLVRHNDGSGSFESLADGLPRLPVGTPPGLLAIHYLLDDGHAEADFDGDGYLDLLLTAELTPMSGPTRRESRLLLGLPDGRLQDAGPAAAGQRIVGEPNRPILVRDLDADGDLDLAVPDQLWLNDGGNQFSADLVTLLGYDPIDAAQIDGDPGLELLARPNVFGMVGLVLFDPGLTGPPAVFPVSASLTGGERFADLDDDADLDLIFLDYYASQIRIYENVGNLLLPSWNSAPGIINFSPTVVGDFDGDGQTDFISGDRLFRNMGPGNTTGFQEVARMGYVVEAAGDLDGDGDLDFLGGVTQSNRLRVPTAAGAGLQYGTGTPGSGGFRPLLGFDGPLDPASPTAAVRLANGLGAGSGMLYVGLVSNDQPDYGAPGLTSYVDPGTIVNLFSVQLGGVLNAAGEGEIRLPFAVLPAWIGLRVYLQAAFYDPAAPYFHTVTNGLELLFGS